MIFLKKLTKKSPRQKSAFINFLFLRQALDGKYLKYLRLEDVISKKYTTLLLPEDINFAFL